MNKFMNVIIGIDFVLPFFVLGLIQYLPLMWLGSLAIILLLLRLIDLMMIVPRLNQNSQYQSSMYNVIVFYHHHRIQSFLIYCLVILILCLVRILLLN